MFQDGMVYGYNDKLCIGQPGPAGLTGCSVPAVELMKILQGMPDQMIEISHNEEKHLLSLSGQTVQAKLKTIQSTLIQSIPDASENQWKILPIDFMEGLRLCLFSASKDMSVVFLNCLNINGDTITSSDNFRISRFQMRGSVEDAFLFPLSAAIELTAIDGVTEYSINEGWVFFRTGQAGLLFCARLVEAEYPDTSALFDIDAGEEFELPSTIKQGLDVCDVLLDVDSIDKKIHITLSNDEVLCRGEGGKGWVEHRVLCSGLPAGLEFDVNPVFLNHVLDHSTSAQVADGKLVFRSDNFTHIMALPE